MNDGCGSGSEEKEGNGYRKRGEVDDGRWIRERRSREVEEGRRGAEYIEDTRSHSQY